MKKAFIIKLVFVLFLISCGNNPPKENSDYLTIDSINYQKKDIQKNDNSVTSFRKSEKRTNKSFKYKGGEPKITFLNEKMYNDTLIFKPEYIIRVKIPDVPDSLMTVALTNVKSISSINNQNEFRIVPEKKGDMSISIGFKDSINANHSNFIYENKFILK
ncbi:MAG: hypothetical protein K9J13_06865 [Saprospiraceae bacterium]|nr:hypothetical protein [Saprospiraceae bacterium]